MTNVVYIQAIKHLFDVVEKWNAATDPKYKKYLEGVMNKMRHNLGMGVDENALGMPMPPGMAKRTPTSEMGMVACSSFEMVFLSTRPFCGTIFLWNYVCTFLVFINLFVGLGHWLGYC